MLEPGNEGLMDGGFTEVVSTIYVVVFLLAVDYSRALKDWESMTREKTALV